jgi:hypothetical protein
MTNRPTSRTPVAGAAATIVAVLIGAGLAACSDTADTATSSTVPPESTTTEPAVASRSAAQVAHAYWEAIAASDPDAAVALIDPGMPNEDSVKPAGRGRTLAELMEWYDANGWEWEVGDCTDVRDGAVDCDVVVRTDWSDALGIAPSASQYRVAVSDEGVRGLRGLGDDCCPGFDEFNRWVTEMYPDDAAVMWNGPEMNPEIMRLFEVNTARFVDAQENQ